MDMICLAGYGAPQAERRQNGFSSSFNRDGVVIVR